MSCRHCRKRKVPGCSVLTPGSTYKEPSPCARPATGKHKGRRFCTAHLAMAEAGRPLTYV